jgi:hypothetical protein
MAVALLDSKSAAAEDGVAGYRRYVSDVHKNIRLAYDSKLHWHMEKLKIVPTVLSAAL